MYKAELFVFAGSGDMDTRRKQMPSPIRFSFSCLLSRELEANDLLNEHYHPDTRVALSHKRFIKLESSCPGNDLKTGRLRSC